MPTTTVVSTTTTTTTSLPIRDFCRVMGLPDGMPTVVVGAGEVTVSIVKTTSTTNLKETLPVTIHQPIAPTPPTPPIAKRQSR